MRRRTKPRVVWLPVTNLNSLGVLAESTEQVFQVGVGATSGTRQTVEIPLVIDANAKDPLVATTSLADIENSGYRLRRIVGKIWIFCGQSDGVVDSPPAIFVTAGLIVRRCDAGGVSYAANMPTFENELAVDTIDNSGDPWIWRRQWVLGDAGSSSADAFQQLPPINFGPAFGSVSDGPHVDAKTARLVSAEERLFLDITTRVFLQGDGQTNGPPLTVATDLRILASMRSSAGNRKNASR